MEMRWNPTVHAVKRLKERCDIPEHQAKSYLNQLMMTAKYVTTQVKDKAIYIHEKSGFFIVVDTYTNKVITLYKEGEQETLNEEIEEQLKENKSGSDLDDIFVNALLKEYTKTRKKDLKDMYEIKVKHIESQIELHTVRLQHIKCKNEKRKSILLEEITRLGEIEEEYKRQHQQISDESNILKQQLEKLGIQTPIL